MSTASRESASYSKHVNTNNNRDQLERLCVAPTLLFPAQRKERGGRKPAAAAAAAPSASASASLLSS